MSSGAALDHLKRVFREEERFAAAVLFGSVAAGRARADSDVDVAVLYAGDEARAGVEAKLVAALGRVGAAAGRIVHLVDLERADCELRRTVFATGIELFDRSRGRLRELEAHTLLEYFDWEYARRVIDAGQRRRLETAGG